jgi:signal transduction histidine kinase
VFADWVSSSVTPARFFKGGAFRLSVIFSAACVVSGVLLFATIYWQTKEFETRRISAFVLAEAETVSQGTTDQILWTVRRRTAHEYTDKYQDMIFAALFASDGRLIAGNLEQIPRNLPVDGSVHQIDLIKAGAASASQPILAVARRLADGRILVFGRGMRVLTTLANIVARALLLGAIPAIGPVIAAGIWLSRQAQWRVKAVNQSIERIMQGDVHERLPVQDIADDFDHLANGVNRMLAEIEGLLAEVQGVGDNIAHDLRTPLSRVRTLLERGRDKSGTKAELAAVVDRAIVGLDQAQSIITALLRIGEIEGGQRRSSFGAVDLNELVQEVGDLYGPMAEAKQIQFDIQTEPTSPVNGDRDLLIEAIANLLDNAIKFTPDGGSVRLQVADRGDGPIVRISDTGPGIPPEERAAIMRRFYRLDKSRNIKGSGLGLSIVLAITKLHDFEIVVGDVQPGGCFDLLCFTQPRSEAEPVRMPALRRLIPPMVRLTRHRGREANSVDWIDRRAVVGAATRAPD